MQSRRPFRCRYGVDHNAENVRLVAATRSKGRDGARLSKVQPQGTWQRRRRWGRRWKPNFGVSQSRRQRPPWGLRGPSECGQGPVEAVRSSVGERPRAPPGPGPPSRAGIRRVDGDRRAPHPKRCTSTASPSEAPNDRSQVARSSTGGRPTSPVTKPASEASRNPATSEEGQNTGFDLRSPIPNGNRGRQTESRVTPTSEARRAGHGIRTRDFNLGKVALYQLS